METSLSRAAPIAAIDAQTHPRKLASGEGHLAAGASTSTEPVTSESVAYFVIAGQSLAAAYTHHPEVLAAFEAEFLTHNPQYSRVEFYNVAQGGSALLRGTAENRAAMSGDPDHALNYWFDETGGADGPNLDQIEVGLAEWAQGRQVLGIIWDQGQAETSYLTSDTAANYVAGLEYVFARLMELSGAEQVFIQGVGDRHNYRPHLDGGTDLIRALQQAFPDDHPYARLVSTTYDLPLSDSVHLTLDAYIAAGVRMARGIATGEFSPEVDFVVTAADGSIYISIALLAHQGLALADASTAFRLYDAEGAEVGIASTCVDSAAGVVVITPAAAGATLLRHASALFSWELDPAALLMSGDLPVHPFNADLVAGDTAITALDTGYRFVGSDGDDVIVGFRSNDVLNGGVGADVMIGGAGDDAYFVNEASDVVVEYDGGGTDRVITSISFRLPAGVENMSLAFQADLMCEGNGLANRLVGGNAADILRGYRGDDTLRGGDRDDRLYGDAGSDRMDGGSGSDVLSGGDNDDILVGGAGTDRLYGQGGADIFRFRASDSPGLTRSTADLIRDFSQGEGDVIDLRALGDLTFVGDNEFSGQAGELRYRRGRDFTFVEADLDGDGAADFMVQLSGIHDLKAEAFML